MTMFSWCVPFRTSQFNDRTKLVTCIELDSNVISESILSSPKIMKMPGLSHCRKVFISVFVAAILLVALVAPIFYFSIYNEQSKALESMPVPLISSIPFEQLINEDIDPCNDFYSFVCGGWESSSEFDEISAPQITPFTVLQHEIEIKLKQKFKESSVQKDFPQILNNAILFYQSCIKGINEEVKYSKSLQNMFNKIGGWPLILGESWNETIFDWTMATVILIKTINIETGFGVGVGVNFENTTENLLVIKPPSLTKDLLSDFIMIFYAVASGLNPSLPAEEIKTNYLQTVAFEKQFRSILQTSNIFKNIKISISKLREEIPMVDWLVVLQSLTNETLCPSQCLTKDDYVVVNDIESLKKIVHFMDHWNGTKREVSNFFSWLIIADIYHIIPGIFKKFGEYFDYTADELNNLVQGKCYDTTYETFGYGLEYLFIKSFSYFNIKESEKLVHYSKEAFKELIISAVWLDKDTKSKILLKLDAMFDVVGYPYIYLDKNELDKICQKFPVMTNDVIHNYVESSKYFIRSTIYRLKHSNNLTNYILPRHITHVSAYYDLNRNVIVFPLSIQYPPFYHFKGPWYLNFGAIGSIIGHEINHAFDNRGHLYDKNGNLKNWWSNECIDKFNKKLSCFEKQFNKYKYEFQGVWKQVNGTRTVGENMADSSGLRQAFLAYKIWRKEIGKDLSHPELSQFNQDQMFFISFASIWCSKTPNESHVDVYDFDFHSPPQVRVNGAVSNSEDFAHSFNCSKNSPMNPSNKCVMW